ncbi:hypothetical protein BDV32DRAFT_148834 [Aspergillus pseudonomiae]|uniref:Uncharacterized protein n=1 Tax=Aspergillus pseudonomiae TaxID=1506151 RepID=A0A5N6I767_9EURO|nr:uncharacterized protein BDV37DRAFT_246424 [Aspergillus pseudonomiae]KAB8260963.1 hypothetical protein BDV32DRAFT_148834 [Aspergillus pseudonomiae]KAE8404846.1 hypothetical protein BDV37DRAFT_246424 [Aspergillus pseudonomiae]
MAHRTAMALVRNDTSQPIYAVGLAHKYSDQYQNSDEWDIIQPGKTSTKLQVDYTTGWWTTGRDWWKVFWVTQDESTLKKTFHYSNPENLRKAFDTIEGVDPALWVTLAASVGSIASTAAGNGPFNKTVAGVAALAARPLTAGFLAPTTTVGFKQHILREEDDSASVEIIIHEDTTITIKSPSGISQTVSTKKEI